MAALALALVGLCAALWPPVQGSGSSSNPFLGKEFYVNPVNAKEFDTSIATASGHVKANLEKMQKVPSAYWIDRKVKIRGHDTTTVEGILQDASAKSPTELVVLMWYDLPNRDCDAKASNGEICCTKGEDGRCDYAAPGDCSEGLEEYKTGYVDPFVSALEAYDGKLQVVLVLEPDGLANLATNIADPHCGNMATQTAYKQGVKYAVDQITAKAPSVAIYLDAAHGGWLGWENNMEKFMKMLKGLQLPLHKVRGFATNVANYQALGIQCPWCPDQGFRNGYCLNNKHQSDPCCEDPCKLLTQWNFGNNELNYAAGLVAAAKSVLGMDAHVIIDTGRNGVTDQRQDCANWCNPRGAGTGVPSTTETANTSLVDAYFWLKTPGESDGCSQTLPDGKQCPRFDAMCASVDSLGVKDDEPKVPEAGMWFDFQVKQLAANARFEPPKTNSKAKCPASANQPVFFNPQPPSSSPSTAGGSSASASASTSASASSSSSVGGSCAGAYQQCGGQGWTGARCCQAGCHCNSGGGYYSQCVPQDPSLGAKCSAGPVATLAPSSSRSIASTSRSTSVRPQYVSTSRSAPERPQQANSPARPSSSGSDSGFDLDAVASIVAAPGHCAVAYGQCGGSGWTGPTCCDAFCTCQFVDSSRSECTPANGQGASNGQRSDTAVIMKDELHSPLDRPFGGRPDPSGPAAGASPWAAVQAAVALLGLAAFSAATGRAAYDSLARRAAGYGGAEEARVVADGAGLEERELA